MSYMKTRFRSLLSHFVTQPRSQVRSGPRLRSAALRLGRLMAPAQDDT